MSSLQPSNHEDDSESSVSTSSDESLVSDDEAEIITIGGPKKPDMRQLSTAGESRDLKARLSSFLPQLLASGSERHNIEDVEENEQHIEMNLGLGVLEEQGDSDDDSSNEDSDDDGADEELDVPASSGAVKRAAEDRDANVMSKLMGQPAKERKAGVEELG
ncbi:hypothetical protein LTR37_021550 [Vermiconidia calcicola]|uniref:Uncharacterized protein n=1 Tax=Vermiconidia calcicola TaxID=1690605 RepID=A0ACC3M8L9_9PEZI|nr:hypothetical protein LTR37_021550 [Vermiconidia calcicola]